MTKRKPLGRAAISVGDTVLMGMQGISMPSDWDIARVLWLGEDDVLVAQSHIGGGKTYPHLHDRSYIRAVGTIEQLAEIRQIALAEVEPLKQAVRDAEASLNRARDAVWAKLDELAVELPKRNAGGGI